jgi:TRAP-type uncharacterized transport system fused permease subunit
MLALAASAVAVADPVRTVVRAQSIKPGMDDVILLFL